MQAPLFAKPTAASTKRATKQTRKTFKCRTIQMSQSSSNLFESGLRQNKLSASMTELPSFDRSSALQDKENGQSCGVMKTMSQVITKSDCLRLNDAAVQAQMEQLGIHNGIPCTPRFVPQVEELPKPRLPIVEDSKMPDLRMINSETLSHLLTPTPLSMGYNKILVIDCRFAYEFEGGHIRTALNVNATDDLLDLLLQPEMLTYGSSLCIVLHCEFSSQRGPKMYRFLRNMDRDINKNNYPQLSFPEIYVLRGGYREFFKTHRHLCEPDNYIEMNDPEYAPQLREAMRQGTRSRRKHRSRSCSELDLSTRMRVMQAQQNRLREHGHAVGLPLSATQDIPITGDMQPQLASTRFSMYHDDDDPMQVDPASPQKVTLPQSLSTSALDFSHRRNSSPHSPVARAPAAGVRRSLATALSFENLPSARMAEPSDFTPRLQFPVPVPDFGSF